MVGRYERFEASTESRRRAGPAPTIPEVNPEMPAPPAPVTSPLPMLLTDARLDARGAIARDAVALLGLQRTIGNRAVQRLLQPLATPAAPASVGAPTVQRIEEKWDDVDLKNPKLAGGQEQYQPKQMKYAHTKALKAAYLGERAKKGDPNLITNPALPGSNKQQYEAKGPDGKVIGQFNTKYLKDAGREQFRLAIDGQIKRRNTPYSSLFSQGAHVQRGIEGVVMYVMAPDGEFFAGKPDAGRFQHSSFLAAGPVACAGEMSLAFGKLTYINNFSGHYQPDPANLTQALQELRSKSVPLEPVEVGVKFEGMRNPAGQTLNAVEYLKAAESGTLDKQLEASDLPPAPAPAPAAAAAGAAFPASAGGYAADPSPPPPKPGNAAGGYLAS